MSSLDDEEGSLYTSIGIGIAITGNVLISLALNIQKVAHKHLHDARRTSSTSTPNLSRQASNSLINQDESRPLLPRTSTPSPQLYGAAATKPKKFPRITIFQKVSTTPDNSLLSPQAANGELDHEHDDDDELHEANGTESDYLRSKLWSVYFVKYDIFLHVLGG